MKNSNVVFFLIVLLCFCSCGNDVFDLESNDSIVPRPKEVKAFSGYFLFEDQTVIYCDSIATELASNLSKRIEEKSSLSALVIPFEMKGKRRYGSKAISLRIDTAIIGFDAYELDIKPDYIVCSAAEVSGLRYGLETLLQLFVKTDNSIDATTRNWLFPALTVKDQSKNKIRSLLTESDILSSQENYRKYIDLLSHYKFNTLRVEFPKELWMSDDLVIGQTDSIRSLLRKRYQYARSRGIQLEADVNFVDVLGMELINNRSEFSVDSTIHTYKLDNLPAGVAMDFAEPILKKIAQFFPFDKIHLGDPELNNMGFFCDVCEEHSGEHEMSLLDSISLYMHQHAIGVDFSGYKMSYEAPYNDSIKYNSVIDLNASFTDIEEVYDGNDEINNVYCLQTFLEEAPVVKTQLLAYADRMWGQQHNFADFERRVKYHCYDKGGKGLFLALELADTASNFKKKQLVPNSNQIED